MADAKRPTASGSRRSSSPRPRCSSRRATTTTTSGSTRGIAGRPRPAGAGWTGSRSSSRARRPCRRSGPGWRTPTERSATSTRASRPSIPTGSPYGSGRSAGSDAGGRHRERALVIRIGPTAHRRYRQPSAASRDTEEPVLTSSLDGSGTVVSSPTRNRGILASQRETRDRRGTEERLEAGTEIEPAGPVSDARAVDPSARGPVAARYSPVVSTPTASFSPQKQVVALNPNPSAPTPASKPVVRFPSRRARIATTVSTAASSARTSRSGPPTFVSAMTGRGTRRACIFSDRVGRSDAVRHCPGRQGREASGSSNWSVISRCVPTSGRRRSSPRLPNRSRASSALVVRPSRTPSRPRLGGDRVGCNCVPVIRRPFRRTPETNCNRPYESLLSCQCVLPLGHRRFRPRQ